MMALDRDVTIAVAVSSSADALLLANRLATVRVALTVAGETFCGSDVSRWSVTAMVAAVSLSRSRRETARTSNTSTARAEQHETTDKR
jgi:hypothetical protein